jgi:sulfate adenylyltransferase subunit 1
VTRVAIGHESVTRAQAADSVTVEIAEERDIARGDIIAGAGARYGRRFIADLCWLDENGWAKGARYVLRQGALETQALIEEINFVRDVRDLTARAPAAEMKLNDIASISIAVRDPILADLYADLPGTGAFALFDPKTNQTCGAGMIREVLG